MDNNFNIIKYHSNSMSFRCIIVQFYKSVTKSGQNYEKNVADFR